MWCLGDSLPVGQLGLSVMSSVRSVKGNVGVVLGAAVQVQKDFFQHSCGTASKICACIWKKSVWCCMAWSLSLSAPGTGARKDWVHAAPWCICFWECDAESGLDGECRKAYDGFA